MKFRRVIECNLLLSYFPEQYMNLLDPYATFTWFLPSLNSEYQDSRTYTGNDNYYGYEMMCPCLGKISN